MIICKRWMIPCPLDSAETSEYPILVVYQPLQMLCKSWTAVLHRWSDSCFQFAMLQLTEIPAYEPVQFEWP